jgi:hypothetical protein
MSTSTPNPKYACFAGRRIINGISYKVKAEWLPAWYGVPHKECIFVHDEQKWNPSKETFINLHNCIILTVRQNRDYKEYLKILRTNKLLEGT